jgi:NAD(P)-dependent dehydrogenase (short-subunit alcohol dehydrogenase family)
VSGATGTTGGATVRALRDRGAEAIVGVHSPDKAGELEALGATVRPFDLADRSGMADATRGAERLYLVTPVSDRTAELTEAMIAAAQVAGNRSLAADLSCGPQVIRRPRATDIEMTRCLWKSQSPWGSLYTTTSSSEKKDMRVSRG